MAKRIIPIEVRDEYILGAGRVIGAKGSHDDVALRVEFNEMWRGKSVTAVWLNAVGESPVVAPINFSNWEGSNPLICIIDIPAKAKSAVGDAMLTIRGFTSVDGETESTATLTATAYFKVLESDFDNEAEEEEEEDKLNLYQQLQSDITALETTMSNAIVASKAAVDARDDVLSAKEEIDITKADIDSILVDCQSCADNAAASESNASTYAENAFGHMEAAAISAGAALGERQDAEKAQAAAEAAKMSAADSAKTANEAASEAADFSEAANDSANEAASSSTAASKSASAAAQSATQAAASASTAQSAASKAHSDVEAIQDTIDEFMDSGIEEAASAAREEVDRILAELEPPIDEAIGYANDAAASADRAYREAERAEAAADRAEAGGGGDVSKAYVDAELAKKLDKTGGTLTGDLNIGSADINVENGNVGVADLFSNWSALNAGNIKMVTDEGTVTLSPAGGLTFEDTFGNKKSIGGISYIEEIDPNAVTYSDMEEYVEEYVAANGGGVSEEYVNEELAKKLDKTGGTMSDEEGISETTLSPYGVEIEDIDLRSQAKFDISGVHFTVSTDEGEVAGGGRISGLMDATLDHEAVTLGQLNKQFFKTLKMGTKISSGEDLNTYKTIGVYTYYGTSGSVKNTPDGVANFRLEVFFPNGDSVTRCQELLDSSKGVKYYRRVSLMSNKWSEWTSTYNSQNKPTAEEIGALAKSGGTVEGDIVFDGGKIKGLETATADDEAVPFGQMKEYVAENGGGAAIIDVTELPTQNINEDVFYRVVTGSFVFNQFVQNDYTVYCVDTLPEVGEAAFVGDLSDVASVVITAYFNVSDGGVYAYVTDILSGIFGVPAGWYPVAVLMSAVGYAFNGVIADIMDDPMDNTFRLLLEYVIWQYKDSWVSLKSIGRVGTGPSAEVFNHPSNIASGNASHAEGFDTTASGQYSHTEGYRTVASGSSSHAEGVTTTASGNASHAEGYYTTASGHYSHAEGLGTTATIDGSHVEGRYNIKDYAGTYVHIVGNGTTDLSRSNAHTLDWDGNAWFAGDVFVGEDETKLATVTELNEVKTSVSEGKALIASAVTDKGVTTAGDATFAQIAENIAAIPSGGGGDSESVAALLGNTMTVLDNSLVTSLRTRACQNATKLVTVNLPNVTNIGGYAFYQCSGLVTVKVPKLTTISTQTWYMCQALQHADCGQLGSITAQTFASCAALKTLILRKTSGICTLSNANGVSGSGIGKGTGYVYVPASLLETYKTATNWSTFAAQFRAIEDYPDICGG